MKQPGNTRSSNRSNQRLDEQRSRTAGYLPETDGFADNAPSKLSNNPPISLELTTQEAEFLLKSCTSNVRLILGMLQTIAGSSGERQTAIKLIEANNLFIAIRRKLIALGAKDLDE